MNHFHETGDTPRFHVQMYLGVGYNVIREPRYVELDEPPTMNKSNLPFEVYPAAMICPDCGGKIELSHGWAYSWYSGFHVFRCNKCPFEAAKPYNDLEEPIADMPLHETA